MSAGPYVITLVVPTSPHPIGGIMMDFEYANAMTARGHELHLVHLDLLGYGCRSTDDIPWATFDPRVQHHFVDVMDYRTLPDADFAFVLNGLPPARNGLPAMIVQSHGIFTRDVDAHLFRLPYPKIVVASWLVEIGKELGVPPHQLVHVPLGLSREKYRITTPIEDRPPRVAMVYRNHPTKGPAFGLRALERAKELVPELQAVVFGQKSPKHTIPSWITYATNPAQETIVDDFYNGSSVFVSSSVIEGFGLPCVEAMACGCAVVTTENGGSADYAIHGETALVSAPRDVETMARHIEQLVRDDSLRIRLAANGDAFVARFEWDRSAEALEDFLGAYAAAPAHYQQPASDMAAP